MNRERLANLKSEVSKQFSGTTKYSKAFRRGNTQALDISQTFPTFEHAFAYALNDTENDNYVPYAGQVISEAENGTVYILRKYSADVRYIDLPVGEGETLESYEIKKTDRFHYYLQEIKTVEGDNSKYLRADADSDNSGHTLTVGKLVSQKGADVTGNVNVTGDVSATGNVTGKNVTATGKVTTPEVVTGGIHSEGADSQQGFSIGKEGNGGYTMYVDNLHVRNKMTAETLEIEETTYVGGKLVLTPGSGIECKKVEYGNFANGQGFKCWFTNEVDGVVKHNTFQVGDLALCESFNNNQHTFYWREVAEVGDDYIILSDVDGKYHTDSDNPKAGDKIVQCGNVNGGERASAIVLSAIDTGSPFVAQYKNIVTFEWTTPVTKISEDGNIITGTLKTESGKDVEKYINDTNDTITKLQEGMQSLGDDNFVIWQADYPSPKTDTGTISEELSWSAFAPSNSWAVKDLDSHTGDYLICSDGIVYIFREVDKTELEYIWEIVTDKYLIDALNKALQAQETADDALETANSVVEQLNRIANDGIITLQEKLSLKSIWDNVQATYTQLMAEAVKYSVDSNAYKSAYDTLKTLIDTILASATDYTLTSADNYSGKWSAYYTAESNLYSAIVTATKKLADDAQTTADGAVSTLTNMASDNIITLQEKLSLKSIWDNVQATYTQLMAEAVKYSVDSNAYKSAYDTLKTLIDTILASATDYTLTSADNYSGKWSAYYTAESNLYSAIVTATKKLADDAQKLADEANTSAGNAMAILNDMADDGVVTAQEKISLNNVWQTIKSQYATKIYEGSQNDFAVEHGTLTGRFTNAFAELTEVMNYVLTDLTTDTDITHLIGDKNLSFTGCWTAYFSAYEDYTKALDDYLKEVTDNLAEGIGTALQTLENMADDGIITAQEKISLKDWWNNELNEANSIITNANKIYGEENDTNANWYKFYALKNLASTLMNNVLSNMDSATDISAKGSIFVSYTAVQSATKDNSIEGSKRTDKNLVWSEFWAIYYQYKATCQNTAEAKAKVFVTAENVLPKPPYKKGDMWICPSYTYNTLMGGKPTPITYVKETFVCIVDRGSNEQASFNDWQVMYDQTSSHMELLKESIKFWVEKDSEVAGKIQSGIDLLAEGVKIYHTKSDGTKEQINLISVGEDGIKINADLIEIDAGELDIKSQLAKFTTNELEIISTYFKVDKHGRITATAGSIGGYEITEHGIKYVDNTTGNQVNLSELGIYFGQTASTERMTSISADGKITAIDADLTGKITATSGKIANMDIASTEVSYQQQAEDGGYFSFGYDGIKAGYMTAEGDGYKPVTTTTIGKDGTITAPNVEFKKDGSGHVAGGNIAWDKNGNASFRGSGTFEGMIKAKAVSFERGDIKYNSETNRYYIDMENEPGSIFAPIHGNNDYCLLPNPNVYPGMEITLSDFLITRVPSGGFEYPDGIYIAVTGLNYKDYRVHSLAKFTKFTLEGYVRLLSLPIPANAGQSTYGWVVTEVIGSMFIPDIEIGSGETTSCSITNRQQVGGSTTKLTAIEISDLFDKYVDINQNSATFKYGGFKLTMSNSGLIIGDVNDYHLVIGAGGVVAYDRWGTPTARLQNIDYSG